MEHRSPTEEEYAIGIKAAKAAGIYGRDQVKWAVDMWRIHMGLDEKPRGWKDPYATSTKKKAAPAKAKKKK